MKRWGRMTKFLSLFCLCLLFIVSCTPKQQTNTPAPSAITSAAGDGRITIGTTGKPRTLDPADAYELSSLGLIFNMSDRLYTYEPGSTEIKPQLATELPKVSADGLNYSYSQRSIIS